MRFVWITAMRGAMWAMYLLAENVEVEQCMGGLLQGGKSKK